MTIELYWLTLTALMTALFWLTYVVDRMVVRGLWATIADRKPEGGGAHSLWAQRAIRAHANAIENLVVFAAAVLVAHAANVSTPLTRAAAATYFFARVAHFLVYAAGVPLLRTLSFTVGWLAQLAILAAILGWA